MGIDLMKKILFALMMVLTLNAFADGNSLVINKRKPDDSGMDQIVLAVPTVSQIVYQEISDYKPHLLALGANMDLTAGVLSVTGMFSGAYSDLTGKPTIPAAQIQSDWNQATTSAADYIKNKPAIAARSQALASHALNSAFQVNASRDALVVYSVRITTTVSIGSNQDGDVILEIASDSGFTSNVQTLSIGENGQTVSLAIALNSVQAQTVVVSGYVPSGYYARLRTVNNTGTPTYVYRAGQEVLL